MAANDGRSRKDGIFYMAKSNRSGVWQRTMVIVGFVLDGIQNEVARLTAEDLRKEEADNADRADADDHAE